MKRILIFVLMLGIAGVIVFSGCSSKTTKTQPVATQAPLQPPVEKKTVEPESTAVKPETKPEQKKPYEFSNIYFDYDKSDIKPDMRKILADHARALKDNPNIKLVIEGHCDERGTIEYNLALGERRANAVKNYLENYGIDANRLSTISYGKERPLDPGHNEAAWAKNRRAQFEVMGR